MNRPGNLINNVAQQLEPVQVHGLEPLPPPWIVDNRNYVPRELDDDEKLLKNLAMHIERTKIQKLMKAEMDRVPKIEWLKAQAEWLEARMNIPFMIQPPLLLGQWPWEGRDNV